MITIAHRLNTIIASDRVLVLSYGKIKEYDTPNALMNNPDSEFKKLLEEMKKEEESETKTAWGNQINLNYLIKVICTKF